MFLFSHLQEATISYISRPFPHKSPVIVTKQNADESPRSEQRTPETWPRPAHPCADYTQTQTDKTQLTRNTIAHYYTLDRGINIIIP